MNILHRMLAHMGRGIRAALLLPSLLFLSPLGSCAEERAEQGQSIHNPVWPRDWADPTVWQGEDGRYHSISTGLRRTIVSSDLFHWEAGSHQPIDETSLHAMHSVAKHFWAPDVATVDGRRNLYISLYNRAEDSNIGVLQQGEDGQFHYKGIITQGKLTGIEDTIDPEVVTDEETGQVWLFFGSVGGIHRVELAKDGLSLKDSAPRYEHVAGLTVHQCPERTSVFEGAYLYRHGGYWYLFVSSGHYFNHTYALRVGRSTSLSGTFTDREGRPMTEGNATLVLSSEEGDHFYGPGHCGEIFTTADGRDYIFYHCHVRGMRNPGSRPMLMSRIQWAEDGWPFVEGGKPEAEVSF